MGKMGRIFASTGCALAIGMTSWAGLAVAHADSCVWDSNTSVCTLERGGVEPGVDGYGGQRLLEVSHYGPYGAPVIDNGTYVRANQAWFTAGDFGYRSTDVNATSQPQAPGSTLTLYGVVHQDSYNDGSRYTWAYANPRLDGPAPADVAAAASQYRSSPDSCATNAQGSYSVVGVNGGMSSPNGLGCPVEVPEIGPTQPLG